MQLYDLNIGDLFEWQGSIYELLNIPGDQAKVVCRYRIIGDRLTAVSASPENFNPYADVVWGHTKVIWTPHSPSGV